MAEVTIQSTLYDAIQAISDGKGDKAQRLIISAMNMPIPHLISTQEALRRCQEELRTVKAQQEDV